MENRIFFEETRQALFSYAALMISGKSAMAAWCASISLFCQRATGATTDCERIGNRYTLPLGITELLV
jgi:hypothetical protein